MNGDGKADIVGMKSTGTYVAFSTGTSFRVPVLWVKNFGVNAGGWTSMDLYPRVLGDATGDGRADITGFGNNATYVSVTNAGQFLSGSALGDDASAPVDCVSAAPEDAQAKGAPETWSADLAPASPILAWRGEYYANDSLSGEPALVRDAAEVLFDWGQGAPDPALPEDGFSARWTQTLRFEESLYAFYVVADDGVRLFVDDQLTLDSWDSPRADEASIQVPLSAGEHQVRLEYRESTGDAYVRLWWEQMVAPRLEREVGERGSPQR
jgi:hypothetical protein